MKQPQQSQAPTDKRKWNDKIGIPLFVTGLASLGSAVLFWSFGPEFDFLVRWCAAFGAVSLFGRVFAWGLTISSPIAADIVTGEALKRISEAKPGDIQEIAASQIELLSSYYQLALEQQRKSFKWALIAAGIGLACFLAAGTFLFYRDLKSVALISTISGTTVQIISGIQFYLYAQTTKQLADFHLRLDITQRFLLANSVCESLTGETQEKARHELVQAIAGIKADKETKQGGI